MTPTQRRQLANILLKEGEENWRVERRHVDGWQWGIPGSDHDVDHYQFRYRAVRIERTPTRTPLPIEHYKTGMMVKLNCGNQCLIIADGGPSRRVWDLYATEPTHYPNTAFSAWRWPNETEWKPAYTETVEERVVQTLIVEGL